MIESYVKIEGVDIPEITDNFSGNDLQEGKSAMAAN